MIAYCLADVFNLELWPRHRPPVYPEVAEGLRELTDRVSVAVPSAGEVNIRLYGGWHRESLDARVDLRLMLNRAIEHSPKRYGKQRVRVQLADHPIWDPSISLLRSLRDVPMTRLNARLKRSERCFSPATCSFEALRAWCSGKCPEPSCPVKLRQVAQQTRQKMVDTLLTADAMAIIQGRLAHAVVLVSDDADMVPALLALSASDLRLTHLRRQVAAGPGEMYDSLLHETTFQVEQW